jgi:hypothetical protein
VSKALSSTVCGLSASVTLLIAGPAVAKFQIQEAGIEKGEVEIEYRGAYHWGVPRVTDANPNANDLCKATSSNFRWASVTGGLFRLLLVSTSPLARICNRVPSKSRQSSH